MSLASKVGQVTFSQKSGVYMPAIMCDKGDLYQEYDGEASNPSAVAPDFTTLKPTLSFILTSSRVAEGVVVPSSVKWYFNDLLLSFSSNLSTNSLGGETGHFKNIPYAAGSVDYVFAGGGSTSTAAVIVYEDRSTAGFESLTGGAADYAIYKNGVRANAGDMRRYDVATYSPMDNVIRVCDTRIAGYYEDCSPNPEAPSTITVLGHEFSVLPSARQSVSQFRVTVLSAPAHCIQ